jgi:hypothetical protein
MDPAIKVCARIAAANAERAFAPAPPSFLGPHSSWVHLPAPAHRTRAVHACPPASVSVCLRLCPHQDCE